jgi:hypothetical protein
MGVYMSRDDDQQALTKAGELAGGEAKQGALVPTSSGQAILILPNSLSNVGANAGIQRRRAWSAVISRGDSRLLQMMHS